MNVRIKWFVDVRQSFAKTFMDTFPAMRMHILNYFSCRLRGQATVTDVGYFRLGAGMFTKEVFTENGKI